MFHYWDSPRLLVCDTGLHMEQNGIGFISVAICGGYISISYPNKSNMAANSWHFLHLPTGMTRIEPRIGQYSVFYDRNKI